MPKALNPPRAEHLAWCKQRALEYLDDGRPAAAFSSMMSDLGKHPETAPLHRTLDLGAIVALVIDKDIPALRRWIEELQ